VFSNCLLARYTARSNSAETEARQRTFEAPINERYQRRERPDRNVLGGVSVRSVKDVTVLWRYRRCHRRYQTRTKTSPVTLVQQPALNYILSGPLNPRKSAASTASPCGGPRRLGDCWQPCTLLAAELLIEEYKAMYGVRALVTRIYCSMDG
jgi:hypothetical protein